VWLSFIGAPMGNLAFSAPFLIKIPLSFSPLSEMHHLFFSGNSLRLLPPVPLEVSFCLTSPYFTPHSSHRFRWWQVWSSCESGMPPGTTATRASIASCFRSLVSVWMIQRGQTQLSILSLCCRSGLGHESNRKRSIIWETTALIEFPECLSSSRWCVSCEMLRHVFVTFLRNSTHDENCIVVHVFKNLCTNSKMIRMS
jgi:hypothetical protein